MNAATPIRFGVIGATSHVAQIGVVPAILNSRFATLKAVSSRSYKDESQGVLGVRNYSNYVDLLQDNEVDAVYIALPNHLHLESVLKALDSNKHVLCEKPMAISESDFNLMRGTASKRSLVLAEAYMTAYHPRHRLALSLVEGADFGEVQTIYSTFSGMLKPLSGYRMNLHEGGGSLWDIGVYALSPVLKILGPTPQQVSFRAERAESSGVDLRTTMVVDYPENQVAFVHTSFISSESQLLKVIGSKQSIEIQRACTPSSSDIEIMISDTKGQLSHLTSTSKGPYDAMIDDFSTSLLQGLTPLWSLEDSLTTLRVIERLHSEPNCLLDRVVVSGFL